VQLAVADVALVDAARPVTYVSDNRHGRWLRLKSDPSVAFIEMWQRLRGPLWCEWRGKAPERCPLFHEKCARCQLDTVKR
jgi:hypothetical protein